MKIFFTFAVAILFLPVFTSAEIITIDTEKDLINVQGQLAESKKTLLELLGELDDVYTPALLNVDSTKKEKTVLDISTSTRPQSHEDLLFLSVFDDEKTEAINIETAEDGTLQIVPTVKQLLRKNIVCESTVFVDSLRLGYNGDEVVKLQKFLNQNAYTRISEKGIGSKGKETPYFGTLTHKAVIRFQEMFKKDILESVGLSRATGFWGPSTIKKANRITALCTKK